MENTFRGKRFKFNIHQFAVLIELFTYIIHSLQYLLNYSLNLKIKLFTYI